MALSLKELLAAQERLREKETAPEKISVAQLSELSSKETAAKPVHAAAGDNSAKILSELKKHTDLFSKAFSSKKGEKDGGSQVLLSELKKHTSLLTDFQQQLKKDHSYQIWGELKKHTKLFEEGVVVNGEVKSKDSMTYEDVIENKHAQEEQLKLLRQLVDKKEEDKPVPKAEEKSSFGGIGGILTALAVSLGAAVGYIKGYVKMLKSIAEAITPDKLIKSISESFSKVTDFFKSIGNFISNQFDKVKKMFSFMDSSGEIGKTIEGIKTAVSNFFQPIKEGWKMIEEGSQAVKKGVSWIDDIVGGFKSFFGTVSSFSGSFVKVFKGAMKIFEKLALPLTVIMTIWDTVKGAIEGFEKEGVVGAIKGAITGLINSLIMAPLDMLKSAVSWIVGAFGFENAEKFLDSFSFEDLFKQFVDAIFSPIETLKKMFDGAVNMLQQISIPEISFTIPIIDKKVSIGPFYPFGKGQEKASPSAPAEASPAPKKQESTSAEASPTKTEVPKQNAQPSDTLQRPVSTAEVEKVPTAKVEEQRKTVQEVFEKQSTTITAPAETQTSATLDGKKRELVDAIVSGDDKTSNKLQTEIRAEESKSAAIAVPTPVEANAVYNKSADNAEAATATQPSQQIIVNSPTNVSNTSKQNISMPAPIRNTDLGLGSYLKRSAMFV